MTNFRLQIVSIIAIFAAVGAGLVLGSLPRQSLASASGGDDAVALAERNQKLQADLDERTRSVMADRAFVDALAPQLLSGRLRGATVLTLATPSGGDNVDGVVRMLLRAGATLTGSLALTAKFSDPAADSDLLALAADHAAPAGSGASTVATHPDYVDGADASAGVLASVLSRREPVRTDWRATIGAYAGGGYLRGTEAMSAPADVVMVVAGPPDTSTGPGATLRLVTRLAETGRVVVVSGTDRSAGNLVSEVRQDPDLSPLVSTVDNVGTEVGCLLAAWSVADELDDRSGHYGDGPGASLLPKNSP
jgi:hypothetical protein